MAFLSMSAVFPLQYPSYVPNTIETRLSSDTVRNLPVDEDIVYGSSGNIPGAGSPEASWKESNLEKIMIDEIRINGNGIWLQLTVIE